MLFPCGEPCVQYYVSLRNPWEKANFAVSLVIGSVRMDQFQIPMAVRPDHERFSSSVMFADRCMTAFATFTSIPGHIHLVRYI